MTPTKALNFISSVTTGCGTIEDWLKVFEDTTGRDLTQFERWYSQAGTPRLSVVEAWDAGKGIFTLTFTQHTPLSTATPQPKLQVLPITVGLIGADGAGGSPSRAGDDRGRTELYLRRAGCAPRSLGAARLSAPVV